MALLRVEGPRKKIDSTDLKTGQPKTENIRKPVFKCLVSDLGHALKSETKWFLKWPPF